VRLWSEESNRRINIEATERQSRTQRIRVRKAISPSSVLGHRDEDAELRNADSDLVGAYLPWPAPSLPKQ
jgi:hypothetical protein